MAISLFRPEEGSSEEKSRVENWRHVKMETPSSPRALSRTLMPKAPILICRASTGTMFALLWLSAGAVFGGEASLLKRGQSIYEKTCAACHGKKGVGREEFYAEPLVGDLPVVALSKLIAETMPEDAPETCIGQEAHAVASYIHEAFYSAQARPPRIRLSRLTRRQLRQSLADLYAHTGGGVRPTQLRGLKGQYFDRESGEDREMRFERFDPVLDFDFGHAGPGRKILPHDFSIDWRGGLKVDSTGTYEIIVRSSGAFVCYLGAYERKFLDNFIQSGTKTEFRQSVVLSAGRVYPLRVNFFQRRRDKFVSSSHQPPAKISLSWKVPHGTEQLIPHRNLLPVVVPAAFSLQTRLPPDDRTYGYERGIAVDRQWDESTTEAALEFARIASEELWPEHMERNWNKADKNRAQLRSFLTELIETALRGPLNASDQKTYVDTPIATTADDRQAIQRSLLLSLKSPRFLYPMLDSERSISQRAANRLALTLFDSLQTEEWLFLQVRSNELESESQIRAAAQRMVSDYRMQGKTRALMYAWLNLDAVYELTKEETEFEGFNRELVSDLRTSLDAFLDAIVWSDASDYRQLFLADWTYTNNRLANFYGETWRPEAPDDQGLRRSLAGPEHHFGVLSHPYLMSKLAYYDSTSPIHRGVFLIRHLLGQTLRPPRDNFTPLAPYLHPNLTTRERVALQTSPQNCQVCHEKINGIGFTLENFDAAGRYRRTEGDRPIESTGFFRTRTGEEIPLAGPRQLANFLATSSDAQQAFVHRAFQYFVKQPAAAFGPKTLDQLTASFKKNDYNIRKLLVEIAVLVATHPNNFQE